MNKKSVGALLGVVFLFCGDYAHEYTDSREPHSLIYSETYTYTGLSEPLTHVHAEMHTETVATTTTYLAASGARQFEMNHYDWRVEKVSPHRYDTFRDGQFMGSRSKSQLWMDGKFHSRYESLMFELDLTGVANFQIVKGAFSQL